MVPSAGGTARADADEQQPAGQRQQHEPRAERDPQYLTSSRCLAMFCPKWYRPGMMFQNRFSKPLWVLVVFLAMASLLVPTAGAQTTATEILGLVKDSSGATVSGAKVTITRAATGQTLSKPTNDAGEYTFPLIEIGEWTVRVEMQGFRSQTVTALKVETQQKARVDFVLEVGSVTETVEVTATGAVLETENSTVGQVIENKRVADLPLNGRNLIHLAAMVPGVQYGSRSGGADGQGGFPIPGGGMSVIANGQREVHQSITLDGVESITPLYNISSFSPSIDAVEEFKVQTGSYSAEFGQSSGARVEVSMKSGTNKLHATVWEFLRNDELDAETYFLNFQRPASAGRLKKDRLRRNQFGGFVSGPVIKNKTFWSFNYEERRQTQEAVGDRVVAESGFPQGRFFAAVESADQSRHRPAGARADRHLRSAHRHAVPKATSSRPIACIRARRT